MAEEIKKDGELVRDVVGALQEVLKGETLIVRTDEEIKRDADVIQEANAKMEELKDHARNRDGFREAGAKLEMFKMLSGRGESLR